MEAQKPEESKLKTVEETHIPEQSPTAPEIESAPEIEKTSEIESREPDILAQEAKVEQVFLSTLETGVPNQIPRTVSVDTSKSSSSPTGCQYGFGYLRQREKGEVIPDSCIECEKSLDCMLSEYYKAEKSVREIKKWYDL